LRPWSFFGLGVPDDGEEVAAEAVARGLHETEGGVGGDGGVDGGAAGFENIEADLGRERVAGGDHAVRGDHLGAGGAGAAVDPIGLGGDESR